MKFLCAFLVFLNLTFGLPATDEVLSEELFSLLEITGVSVPDRTLESVVAATQKDWLRKPGTERWEIVDSYPEDQQLLIANLCDKMGFFSEVRPSLDNYTHCCILGATLPTAKARMLYAKELWESGVRFEEIVLLTGIRPLDAKVDEVPEFESLPRDEAEGMLKLFHTLDIPEKMRELPVVLICSPAEGGRRPNTQDTILEWMKRPLKQGACLLISNQPWVKYQRAIAKAALKLPFEAVGPKAHPSYSNRAAVMLDNVARWLYADYIDLVAAQSTNNE
jgi:hypothetical protein